MAHSEETKRKISEAKKGKAGHPHTEEHKAHMREVMKGKNVGKVRSEETNRKNSEAHKGKKLNLSEEERKRRSERMKGRVVTEEQRRMISEANKGRKVSEEEKQRRQEGMAPIVNTPEYRAKLSEGGKRAYANPEYRERQRKATTSPERLAFLHAGRLQHGYSDEEREIKRQQMLERWKNDDGTMLANVRLAQPMATRASQEIGISSLEVQVKGLLDALGIRYEQQKPIGIYTADFFLPDHNLILEIYGCYWHACPACGYSYPKKNGYDDRRENYIRACGYNLFILWEHDLKNELDINSLIERKE